MSMGLPIVGEEKERRGRPATELRIGNARPLTPEDLEAEVPPSDNCVVILRQSHHMVAKLIAQGADSVEAGRISGYTSARIRQLKDDPSFQELVAHYTSIEAAHYERTRADMHDRLAALGFDAVEVLHEKLLDQPAAFTNKELLAIVGETADRTGFGKTQTVNANLTLGVDDATLRRIRETPTEAPSLTEEDRGTLLRLAVRQTEAVPDPQAPAWIEGEGHCLREEGEEGTGAEV